MNQKPKILVFAHEPFLNGASHSLLSVLVGLKENFDFLVILPDHGMMEEKLKEHNINYKILNLLRCCYFHFHSYKEHLLKTLRYIKHKQDNDTQLYSIVRDFNPDLVYTNTSVLSVGFRVSKKINKPHVWHIREYGDIDYKIQYLPSRNYMKFRIGTSDLAIYTTKLLQKHWTKSKNAVVVYNGVKVESDAITVKAINNHSVVIGIVGLISEVKGQEQAIEILNNYLTKYKQNGYAVKLNIYGQVMDSNYHKKLEALIETYQISDKVTFMGYVSNEEIYKNIDMLLSCSYNECFGRTLIEAMSKSIPVIAKNSGGPTEIIEDGCNGFLYNDSDDAAEKIDKLLNDATLFDKIMKEGITSVKTLFSEEKYLLEMNSIFNSFFKNDQRFKLNNK